MNRRQIQVHVWRDRRSGGWRHGHLALELPDDDRMQNYLGNRMDDYRANRREILKYISWWPGEESDKWLRQQFEGTTFLVPQKGVPNNQFGDLRAELGATGQRMLAEQALYEKDPGVYKKECGREGPPVIQQNRKFREPVPKDVKARDGQRPIGEIDREKGTVNNFHMSGRSRSDGLEELEGYYEEEFKKYERWARSLNNRGRNGEVSEWWHFFYGQQPSASVSLPIADQSTPGLNEAAIVTWYHAFCEKYSEQDRGQYCFVSKTNNCASVVLRALLAGDASFYHPLPNRWSSPVGWRSPEGVFQYAHQLSVAINQRLTMQADTTERYVWNGGALLPRIGQSQLIDMPTLWRWQQESRVSAGLTTGLARRKGQVLRIDRLLAEYHRAFDPIHKKALLGQIFEECGSYIRNKQNNKRFGPVLELAQRTLQVLATIE